MRELAQMVNGGHRPEPNALVQRKKMENDYLPKALERIYRAIASTNDRIALDAAKWIAEMCLGKPRQPQDGDGGESEGVARILAETLRALAERQLPQLPPAAGVQVLGVTDVIEAPMTEARQVPALLQDNDFDG